MREKRLHPRRGAMGRKRRRRDDGASVKSLFTPSSPIVSPVRTSGSNPSCESGYGCVLLYLQPQANLKTNRRCSGLVLRRESERAVESKARGLLGVCEGVENVPVSV